MQHWKTALWISVSISPLYTILTTYIHNSSQPLNNKPFLKKTVKLKHFKGYPLHTNLLQSLHLYCAFLFIHPNIPFPYTHCHTFNFTFHVRQHNHTQFMYCFIRLLDTLFANPFRFINTNVGPITHPYYTNFYSGWCLGMLLRQFWI